MLKTLSLLALFLSASLSFASKVALVTVSPGDQLFDAFGHSAILVDDKTVYEFQGIAAGNLLANRTPIQNLDALLNSKIAAIASTTSFDSFKMRYLMRGDVHRTITTNQLKLTKRQAAALIKVLDDATATGRYEFGTLTSNCATKIRDAVFSVLPKGATAALNNKTELTYRSILKSAIDDAVSSNGKGHIEFPIQIFARGAAAEQVKAIMQSKGMPLEIKSGDDFEKSLTGLNDFIKSFADAAKSSPAMIAQFTKMSLTEVQAIPALSTDLNGFVTGSELGQKREEADTLITPAALRAGLLKIKLLSKSIVVDNQKR